MVEAQEKFDEMENVEQSEAWFANIKRTYDQYQTLDTKAINDANKHAAVLDNLSTQALQNAVETANMVSKQAVRHGDLAIDRQWNVDEQGYTVADILNDSKFQDAIATALAKITAEMASS
jgi:hypothetical protein